jgi:hypothetical protein
MHNNTSDERFRTFGGLLQPLTAAVGTLSPLEAEDLACCRASMKRVALAAGRANATSPVPH